MPVQVAVIYYSATGNVHQLARAVEEGAAKAGAEVRLRRVPELAPDHAIDANPAWRAHVEAAADVPVATLEDLEWADAYAFGTPTRYGNVAAQLKQFLDSTGGLWAAGKLSGKAATAFTSAANKHGGNESTILAVYNTMIHWGTVIVPPGYTDPAVYAAGGNPYGTAHHSAGNEMSDAILDAARYQGFRLATFARSWSPAPPDPSHSAAGRIHGQRFCHLLPVLSSTPLRNSPAWRKLALRNREGFFPPGAAVPFT